VNGCFLKFIGLFMKTIAEFTHNIQQIENTWIELKDGTRLAARIWLPENAETRPVPAILEYLPYRKNDGTIFRDVRQHPYFAGHGYAAVRVDMRGSGDSDGILYDEYLPQEQADCLEVLAWLAAQPWCTGAVGMIGISWGGFNGLQVAARKPPELKAVISLCSTDDRYADDVHYMGGAMLGNAHLRWASSMFAYNARPPDPRFVGDRWREMWLERMEKSPPFIEAWLSHQRRDAFWKQGSVCEDYSAITCPVYAVGGWADAYTNTVLRLLQGLPGPSKGLIGPWAHLYPEMALPGPPIGFLQECLRWWDYWLKGINTGIMDEPKLRVWMQESVVPDTSLLETPGRWVVEPGWPSADISPTTLYLNTNNLSAKPTHPSERQILGTFAAGMDAGLWCGHGRPGDMPPDQRSEDGRSLTFTSPPAAERIEILGFPLVELTLSSDQPLALVAVRLCDISPGGSSLLVTRGLFNLTHRLSHEFPEPLEPGQTYTVTIPLNAIAHALPAGHRWRVALSPTYWPLAWPSPKPVTLTIKTGMASRLILPIRPPRPADAALLPFPEPETAPPLATELLAPASRHQTTVYDSIRGQYRSTEESSTGRRRILANGLETETTSTSIYTIIEGDPLSAHAQSDRIVSIGRAEWQTRIETSSTLTADAHNFHVLNTLQAYEGRIRVFTKSWTTIIPRDHV
jgi:hypothetical protein